MIKHKGKKISIAIGVFLFCILFVEYIFSFVHTYSLESQKEQMDRLAKNVVNSIENTISYSISATTHLQRLLIDDNYETYNFVKNSERLAISYPNISGFQYAKDGIVSNVYPYEEHKEAIGHDLLKDKRRIKGAIKAISDKKLTFVGPIKLIQNSKYAIIARKPIFDKDGLFWGFATVLMYIDDLVKDVDKSIVNNGYNYKLTGYNPDSKKEPVFKQSGFLETKYQKEYEVIVPNGKWKLYISLTEIKQNSYLKYFFYIVSLILSAILYRTIKDRRV
jgi:sensor domain CHASE-containing protein